MEHPLQEHWSGLLKTRDRAGAFAFADHLIESWDGFVADEAEFHREFGRPMPYIIFLKGHVSLKVRYHTEVKGKFVMWSESVVPPTRGMFVSYFSPDGVGEAEVCPAPTVWDADTVEQFAVWVAECIGR